MYFMKYTPTQTVLFLNNVKANSDEEYVDAVINLLLNGESFEVMQSEEDGKVGNKNDCPSRKVVVTEDAQRFASQMNIPLFETSAKENINVEEMFLTITKMVLRSKLEMKERQNVAPKDTVNLKNRGKTAKKKCC
ncbi:hypothetical protein MSG28_005713 [Choristoneura fumiferana]|uniref:Uncharacterized protein n=1 Tax=Choristoneura fumiferana TaxID=7141 RepID=A0ACC0L0E6_CHOFU|nr:hypothetical protein MSG28_005713 [Choristoneura fumiferana]